MLLAERRIRTPDPAKCLYQTFYRFRLRASHVIFPSQSQRMSLVLIRFKPCRKLLEHREGGVRADTLIAQYPLAQSVAHILFARISISKYLNLSLSLSYRFLSPNYRDYGSVKLAFPGRTHSNITQASIHSNDI